ncbi:MAG TPA: hypothetical protein IAC25_04220 [Candidatus Enterenecus stercoripullorum]|nr:hypothetical protein [Candidatus Enterenecus stercoripullorum]
MGKLKYLAQRVLKMNYKAMLDKINFIHKKTGRSRLAIFRDMKDCAVKYGAGYMDYDLFEMYNLTDAQRDTYLTRGRNNALVVKYNDKTHMEDLGDKIKFNTRFSTFLHRDWVPVTGDNREQVLAFLSRHPVFMAKPAQGSCGWGIEKLQVSDFPSLDALYGHLAERAPLLELEEIIVQHPAVAAIYPGSINTVRMVTIRGESGRVYLVTAMFRIGNGKFVDNFNSGGMVAPMDPETGTVIDRALDKQKNLYENHPATGTPIKGFRFPDWDKARTLVEQAAQVIPEVGYVGWDVCFTPEGPCLVEGNQFPGHDIYQLPVHTPDKIGIMPRFRAIEEQEKKLKEQKG